MDAQKYDVRMPMCVGACVCVCVVCVYVCGGVCMCVGHANVCGVVCMCVDLCEFFIGPSILTELCVVWARGHQELL